MSTDELAGLANMDTPAAVTVPNNVPGLVAWAIIRVGPALVLAVAFIMAMSYAVNKVYADMAATNRIVLDIVRDQSKVNESTASAIRELSKQIEMNTKAMDDTRRMVQPR